MIEKALKTISKQVVKNNVSWSDNEYIPPRTTIGDMKQFWDNLDTKKLERISTIKSKN